MATTPELVKNIAGVDLAALAQRLTAAPSARPTSGDGSTPLTTGSAPPSLVTPAGDDGEA